MRFGILNHSVKDGIIGNRHVFGLGVIMEVQMVGFVCIDFMVRFIRGRLFVLVCINSFFDGLLKVGGGGAGGWATAFAKLPHTTKTAKATRDPMIAGKKKRYFS